MCKESLGVTFSVAQVMSIFSGDIFASLTVLLKYNGQGVDYDKYCTSIMYREGRVKTCLLQESGGTVC